MTQYVADGKILFPTSLRDLDELPHQVEHFSGQYELMLSRSKCCIMHMQASADIHICDNVPLPKAHEAVQLANNSSHTISIRHEVSKDIQAVKRTWLVEATFVLERCERDCKVTASHLAAVQA